MVPALLVDFDAKRLVSQFPEPSGFENYVPDHWSGQHAPFIDEVPEALRYWAIEGRDLFR